MSVENSSQKISPDPIILKNQVLQEIHRLEDLNYSIVKTVIPKKAYLALFIIIILNISMIIYVNTNYLMFWVASSLYFYLFYPLLPIFLFPFRYITERSKKDTRKIKSEKQDIKSMLKWAMNLHILKNKRVGYHLFMRFFLFNLIPITSGIVFIYGISLISTVLIKLMTSLSDNTLLFIIVQCFGIISFYCIAFRYRGNALYRTHIMVKNRLQNHRKMLLLAAVAIVLISVSTLLVLLMIIAMLMPAYTLTLFINMITFSNAGKSISIIVVLLSQFIYMQYLQSLLSRNITLSFINELMSRLNKTRTDLQDASEISQSILKDAGNLMLECGLYSFNIRKLFGLFPVFSIGVNIPNLLKITDLSDLTEVFYDKGKEQSIVKDFLL